MIVSHHKIIAIQLTHESMSTFNNQTSHNHLGVKRMNGKLLYKKYKNLQKYKKAIWSAKSTKVWSTKSNYYLIYKKAKVQSKFCEEITGYAR